MSKLGFSSRVSAFIALIMCGLISVHGGLTLFYLTLIDQGVSSRTLLELYLVGCVSVILIPLTGINIERLVFQLLLIKLVMVIFHQRLIAALISHRHRLRFQRHLP